MGTQTRPSFEDYKKELVNATTNRLFKNEGFYSTYMNGFITGLKTDTFSNLVSNLDKSKEKYIIPEYLFLTDPESVTLAFKPLESILNKIYRVNVVNSRKWPRLDGENLISLDNFHLHLNDIFRTRFICRYLDGPKFACEHLSRICKELGVDHEFRAVTTNLGYHAWHFYYKQAMDDFAGTGSADITIELQFTTQLAEVIGSLTHVQYESSRLGEKFDDDWRWNVNSKQFRPYYIANGLHLLEGVILEFRDSILHAETVDDTKHQINDGDE